MASIPIEIEKRIKEYIAELNNNNIKIQRAIVFGSIVTGSANQWSDIDVALVSDAFQGNRIQDKSKIRRITLKCGSDIEPIPFNPADFNESNPFVKEVLTTGIEIL
jgi:predicted nucleotidyltransferase